MMPERRPSHVKWSRLVFVGLSVVGTFGRPVTTKALDCWYCWSFGSQHWCMNQEYNPGEQPPNGTSGCYQDGFDCIQTGDECVYSD
jgi:hypothetical protein